MSAASSAAYVTYIEVLGHNSSINRYCFKIKQSFLSIFWHFMYDFVSVFF